MRPSTSVSALASTRSTVVSMGAGSGSAGPLPEARAAKAARLTEQGLNLAWREAQAAGGRRLGDGSVTRTQPSARGWDWAFDSLYAAARPRSKLRGGGSGGLVLRLADTVVFDRGSPVKWLGTSATDGTVTRRSLANAYTARARTIARHTGQDRPGKTFEELMVKEQLKVRIWSHHLLIRYRYAAS